MMELISGIEKKKIKDCKVGDIISHSKTIYLDYPYLNIIVPKSITLEVLYNNNKGKDVNELAFNVVCLYDGRVRTFHPEAEVWIYDKLEILIKK